VGIGFFVTAPLIYLAGRRASGKLPLTQESLRKLGRPMRFGIPMIAVAVLLLVIAAITGFAHNPLLGVIGLFSLNFGALALVFGVLLVEVGLQLGRWPFGPGAVVMKPMPGQSDRAVELIRVHPAFVAAVLQMRAAPPPQSTRTN
jgi:hypothetical protein